MAAFGALSRSAMLYCRKAALSPKRPFNPMRLRDSHCVSHPLQAVVCSFRQHTEVDCDAQPVVLRAPCDGLAGVVDNGGRPAKVVLGAVNGLENLQIGRGEIADRIIVRPDKLQAGDRIQKRLDDHVTIARFDTFNAAVVERYVRGGERKSPPV